jgi:hypothetical protein
MDELYSKSSQQKLLLQKIEQKETWLKQFMLVSFKTIRSMKCSSHTSKPYFIFL